MERTWLDELKWCAGFFDGEGHTRANWTHDSVWRLRVDIVQADHRVLDRFAKAVKVGRVYGPYPARSPKHRDRYQYYAEGPLAQAVIAMIWPWLDVLKRDQARDALLKVKSTRDHIRTGLKKMCKRGHSLTDPTNVHHYVQNGYASRDCRACGAERMRISRQRKLARALLVAV